MAKRGMLLESNFSTSLKTLVQSHGDVTIKYHGGKYSEAGVPDRWFCLNLRPPRGNMHLECWLELKTGRGRASPIQLAKVRAALRARARAGILRFAHDRRLYLEIPADMCEVVGRAEQIQGPSWPCDYEKLVRWLDKALANDPEELLGRVDSRGKDA